MKKFKLNIWKSWKSNNYCYCVQILEQPDDCESKKEFKSSTGFIVVSAANPEYKPEYKKIFIQGSYKYLNNAVLQIPEEDFSVFMRSLKEFCKHLEWEFDYEVERDFGNL